jgi:eukaryotic-like serine/threonine-protein kinase
VGGFIGGLNLIGRQAGPKLEALGTLAWRYSHVIDLDRYAILGVLGRGPRGLVYRARDQLTDRLVALKAIDPLRQAHAGSTLETTWFVSDARAAWRLTHPNIATVYAAGDARGKVYIAMELLKRSSLRRELDAGRPSGVLRSIKIAAQIACGLAYAQEQGVVHRNLKPSNVTILGDHEVKITDFGIAHIGDAALLSGEHARCLGYMSPEWIRGDQAIDRRSDIFSLGAVLYEMLTHRSAFDGEAPAEIAGEVLEVEPPLPSELNPEVPPALDGMVMNMLAKDPDDRPADVGNILRCLRRLEEELGERPVGTAHPAEIPVAAKAVPLTAGVRTSAATRLVIDELRIGMRERWQRACGGLIVVLSVATWLSAMWPHFSNLPEVRISVTSTEPAFAMAAEQSSAIGPPTVEDPSNDGPTGLTAAWEPAASAKATVSNVTSESERAVGTAATAHVLKTAPHPTMTHVKQTRAKTGGGLPPKTARLTLAVSPWGSVYINGKFHGTTPPVTTLDLSPGRHLVEVRNSSQPAYVTYATIRAGEVRSVRHDFGSGHEFR